MAKMNPYLNFDGTAEEAFNFYKSVFGGEFLAVHKMADMPGSDQIPENEKNRIMHISLPVNEHTTLMGSDIMPSAGHKLNVGNNVYVSLHPESREEADHLFNGLSAGGVVEMAMADMFWGAYFGSFKDKYGVLWMINFEHRQQ
ncbi:MAG: VOC family protein [Mucilaginibacter sp.]|uniref:VOC family protein n=1 Tax=Mucilaginibacter sp. TaxID=1882438 RepID=UPI0031A57F2A